MLPPKQLSPEAALNVRDIISAFVGQRYQGTQNENARAMYSYLRNTLGGDTAQKLLTHLSLYNQRPDMLKAAPEQRIQSFYEIGSRDPELSDIIGRSKIVAQGPMAGLNDTPTAITQQQQGRWGATMAPAAPGAIAALQKNAPPIR